MCSTAKNLFNLSTFLTKRDAWAGSLGELLTLDEPRTDAPMHLPDAPIAPKCIDPWCPPVEGIPEQGMRRWLQQDGRHVAAHCSAVERTCAAPDGVSVSQRRKVHDLATLTGSPVPDLGHLTHAEASAWIGQKWSEWMQVPAPPLLAPE